MEQITRINMMVQLGRIFKNLMYGHNLMECVIKNRNKVNRDKARNDTKEVLAATQTHWNRPRLAKVVAVAPPMDLPKFTLAVNTVTVKVWIYHGADCPL
jgi:hypothetical protein